MNVPNYDAFAKLVRSLVVVRSAHGGRSARIDRYVLESQLLRLQDIEWKLAAALVGCGTPAEQAAQSAFEFVRQCTEHYAKPSPASC
jgi:hypothetical protein